MGETIGQRIRQFRLARGLSQRALARAIDVSNGAINMIESGDRPNPSYEMMKAIARALNVSLADLDPDLAASPNSSSRGLDAAPTLSTDAAPAGALQEAMAR